MTKLPELLCPAGSKEAFAAAIDGGADAIYVGGTSFNARINAKNFTSDELAECIKLAHAHGVKVYITLNTLIYDKEYSDFLSAAESYANCGADAFIVADLGGASVLHRCLPDIPLHASTQLSAHNAAAGVELERLGFYRLVPARELSARDIRTLVNSNPLEVEIFTHGALCVCHSGQCLFSSIVGGRSGNRGLCAQPCRLPYKTNGKGTGYPLSLKDLSLCEHVSDILSLGVHSLKIEGRMKSPEYVYLVARVWRRLLDERRNATPEEVKKLSEIFSRGGFTDGYFTGRIDKKMLGVRSDADKEATRKAQTETVKRRTPIDIFVEIRANAPSSIRISCRGISATATGDIPQAAISSPISEETVRRNISKLGGTPFELGELSVSLDEGLMLPISKLNELRRLGVEALTEALTTVDKAVALPLLDSSPRGARRSSKTARFLSAEQITSSAKEYFDLTFLPLDKYEPIADGFVMPPVIFDSERAEASRLIDRAIELGATHAIIGNIGNVSLLRDRGLTLIGDFRFNATSTRSVCELEGLGIPSVILSPELTLPQMRDIKGDVASIVYGKLPLMVLERCVIKDSYGCSDCQSRTVFNPATITDRRGVAFPVMREWQHRSVIYNSLPTCMSDKSDQLDRNNITSRHFIFTDESPRKVDRVIEVHKDSIPLGSPVRRI